MAHVIVSLRQVVLDCTDARGLAEFYRQLLRFAYREGDEAPALGEPDHSLMSYPPYAADASPLMVLRTESTTCRSRVPIRGESCL